MRQNISGILCNHAVLNGLLKFIWGNTILNMIFIYIFMSSLPAFWKEKMSENDLNAILSSYIKPYILVFNLKRFLLKIWNWYMSLICENAIAGGDQNSTVRLILLFLQLIIYSEHFTSSCVDWNNWCGEYLSVLSQGLDTLLQTTEHTARLLMSGHQCLWSVARILLNNFGECC